MNDQLHAKHDRRITIVLVLSGIVATLVVLGTPAVISTSNTTDEVRQGNEISGCRAAFNAAVTDARTDFDLARSHRDTAAAERDNAQIAVSVAAIFQNGAGLPALLEDLETKGQRVSDANSDVRAADEALNAANAAYQRALALSRDDPEAFVKRCEQEDT